MTSPLWKQLAHEAMKYASHKTHYCHSYQECCCGYAEMHAKFKKAWEAEMAEEEKEKGIKCHG